MITYMGGEGGKDEKMRRISSDDNLCGEERIVTKSLTVFAVLNHLPFSPFVHPLSV